MQPSFDILGGLSWMYFRERTNNTICNKMTKKVNKHMKFGLELGLEDTLYPTWPFPLTGGVGIK